MKLLITGTGRCGTTTIAEALTRCGVPCGHEAVFNRFRHGQGDWQAESSWLAAPYTPLPADRVYVVHLVRHPLATIRSRAAWGSFEKKRGQGVDRRPKGRWAIQQCPDIARGKTPIERAAWHWVLWNRLIKGARERVRLEDLDDGTVLRLARIVRPDAQLPSGGLELGRTNTAGYRLGLGGAVTWDMVAHVPELLELADQYGYTRADPAP